MIPRNRQRYTGKSAKALLHGYAPSRPATRTADSPGHCARRALVRDRLDALAGDEPMLRVDELTVGYGAKEILRRIDLRLGKGQILCLVGPSGAGKSTILNSIFGLADIHSGKVEVAGRNVTRLGTNARLREAGIAYVLQDSSLFPDLSVEQNLLLGVYLRGRRHDATQAAEAVFERYPTLGRRRKDPARMLSGGELRLLEISRALVMQPRLVLVDGLCNGLEPAYAEQLFEMLRDLRNRDGMTVAMVEPHMKGLEVADIGCVVVSGEIACAGTGPELLRDPALGRLFLRG